MKGFQIHDLFEKNCYIHEEDLGLMVDHICGNLVSWTPNRLYWEEQYNYCNKLYIVINWREKKGIKAACKKG